jgi:uncharacterized protein (DUF1697 family)
MLQTYVAFLRAINVGGHVVKMDALRDLFTAVGYANVKTVIASGNVIFEAKRSTKHQQTIEAHLRAALGYEVKTFLRTPEELQRVAAAAPFEMAEGDVLYVAFLENTPSADAGKRLLAFENPFDAFHDDGAEAYWLRRRKLGQSDYPANFLEKALGMKATVRNMNTVQKIAGMV